MTTTVLAFIPSPSQGVWHLFGVLPIRAYALCIITGIVAALVIGDRRWEARGGERGVIYDVALWAVPFGLIGGRMYHVMTDWPKYFGADGAGFVAALRIWDGGLGIWGAVALGGVGAWIACRRRGIPLPAFGDAVAPGIILAQAIGRLGNYFNQELYGRETDLPWGLTIYDRLDPSGVISPHSLDGVSTGQVYAVVHPTFLYELLWNLLVFAILLWADRRFKLGHGRLFALYVAGYCVGRFWVELMRSDTASLIAGIRVNTFTSTFVFIGAVIYIMVAAKGREDPASLRGKDADRSMVDEVGEELVAVAATSGVVAAAKVAGDEDKESKPKAGAEADTTAPEDGLGSVEGDELEAAKADAAEVHDAAVAGTASEFTGGADTESEAAAEAEDLTEQVATASSEDIAEAQAFAEAGAEADEHREAGLGSVEGDEAVEAELGAVEAHEAAVDGAAQAEALAEATAAGTAEVHDAAVEGTASAEATAADTASEDTSAPEEGLGSVEGDEVEAAQADAAEVHDAAVEGTASAEATAADTATEFTGGADTESEAAAEAEDLTEQVETASSEDIAEAEAFAEAGSEADEQREAGLGSVEGDEAVEAELGAVEAHEAAVEGTASAEAAADTAAQDSTAAPEDGLGSVEGDEVNAAQSDAAEVHDAAVEGTASAEAATSSAAPEDGLGSVGGDEVQAAEADAAVVHDAAVEGTASAEAAADTAAEDSTAAPEDGLGSVEGDELNAAQADAAEVHDAAVEGTASAQATAAKPSTSRRRWWKRN